MKIFYKMRKRERGSSVVEFAIVATILVPLVMYSMYFVDLAKVRLKTQEIARYAAWEMTSYPLSDYKGTNHDEFFRQAARNVATDVRNRYGDDLRADTENHAHVKFMTGDWRLTQIDLTNQEASIMPSHDTFDNGGFSGIIGTVLKMFNGGVNKVLGFWKFNTKGQVKVDVTVRFTNDFVPERFAQKFFEEDLFPNNITTLELQDSLILIADSWTLYDGEDVYSPEGYSKDKTGALLWEQTRRMYGGGIHNIPGLGQINNIISKISTWTGGIIDNPFMTRVASIASRGDINSANDIKVNVDCGETEIHTTPMRDCCLDPRQSEYGKSYDKRGEWYMGCPQSEKEDCFQ